MRRDIAEDVFQVEAINLTVCGQLNLRFRFFFASRRRHTRYWRDWSSDVCSSDLVLDDFVGTIEDDVVVTTTLDPLLQGAAERALVDELNAKGQRYNVSQGAMVAMQPDGALKALVGGRDYEASQFNRATAARRQPGSAFKAFVYLAALERGLTPDTIRDDSPVNYKGWTPENYTRDYRGPVTLRDALALSLNTVAVKLGVEVGPKAVAQTAQRLGIASPLQANPSLALGTSEVTPDRKSTRLNSSHANISYAVF